MGADALVTHFYYTLIVFFCVIIVVCIVMLEFSNSEISVHLNSFKADSSCP